MTALEKPFKSEGHIKSFEEMQKTSYSHGLEAIYTLENVDVKSIRKMVQAPAQLISESPKRELMYENDSLQYEFDLGPQFRNWIRPFLLSEPIEVLKLPVSVEKTLKDLSKDTLGSILEIGMEVKEIARAHLQELKQRLQEYVANRPLHQSRYIDFASWLLSLTAGICQKKLYVFLAAYQLSHLVPLSPLEMLEVKRLNPSKLKDWEKEVQEKLQSAHKKFLFTSQFTQIIDSFFKSWIYARDGLVLEDELQERLQKISVDSNITEKVLPLFQMLYGKTQSFWDAYLVSIASDVYAVDITIARTFFEIEEVANSYFYSANACYSLSEIVTYIQKDYSKNWESYSNAFIEKILKFSTQFYVRKNLHEIVVSKF